MIHKLQKKISEIITLHILYDSLVHRLYKGCHIWRKVVIIVPHYGWMLQGPNFSEGKIFHTHSDCPWGPPSLLYNGSWVSFPGVKWSGHGTDHPSSTEFKKM